jgi:riboflavin synthase
MFTGLIQGIGNVIGITAVDKGVHLKIEAPLLESPLTLGASIALNGCCTTVTAFHVSDTYQVFEVTLSSETLARTQFQHITLGSRLNLELPLLPTSPLGGHYVTGHVDGCLEVKGIQPDGECSIWTIALPEANDEKALFVPKGSVALNGISLTVNTVDATSFSCCIIPHTLSHTTLGDLAVGDFLHYEGDLLGKYVQRQLSFLTPTK